MFNSLKNLSLLASLASAAAIAEFDLVERQATSGTCSTGLHLMIAGGCAVPCLEDVPSLLSTLIGNLTAAFPGSDQYYVPYNNVSSQGQVSTPVMIAAANQYFVDCPNTPVVFIGYSLGGIIVMNTLCGGLSVTNVPNVLAAITYGEETYRYPLSYDAGDCTNSAPNYPRNGTQNCLPFAPAIQDICAATDPNCCVGGTDSYSHYTYPQFYDLKMVAFVQARYAALQATKAATSTTASSTTATASVSTVSTVSTTTTASGSATTVSTTETGGVSTVSLTTTASTAASVSTTVTTISTGSTTTIRSYGNSTFTATTPSVPGNGGTTTTAASGSESASGTSTSTSTKTVAVQVTSTVPAAVSSFPDIPNSVILVPSSVQASYLPNIVTAVSGGITYTGATAAAATATATASAGSGSGSGSSATGTAAGSASGTASGSAVASYTGAADRLSAAGGLVAAGLAAVAMAL